MEKPTAESIISKVLSQYDPLGKKDDVREGALLSLIPLLLQNGQYEVIPTEVVQHFEMDKHAMSILIDHWSKLHYGVEYYVDYLTSLWETYVKENRLSIDKLEDKFHYTTVLDVLLGSFVQNISTNEERNKLLQEVEKRIRDNATEKIPTMKIPKKVSPPVIYMHLKLREHLQNYLTKEEVDHAFYEGHARYAFFLENA